MFLRYSIDTVLKMDSIVRLRLTQRTQYIMYYIMIAVKTAKYGQSRRYGNIGNVNQTLYLYTYYVHIKYTDSACACACI